MRQSGLGSIAGVMIIINLIINVVMIIIKVMTLDTMIYDNHESKPGSIAGFIIIIVIIIITLAYD